MCERERDRDRERNWGGAREREQRYTHQARKAAAREAAKVRMIDTII